MYHAPDHSASTPFVKRFHVLLNRSGAGRLIIPDSAFLTCLAPPSIRPKSEPSARLDFNAVFGHSRRWGPVPAKGEAT